MTPSVRLDDAFSYSGMDVVSSYTPPQVSALLPDDAQATTFQHVPDGVVTLTMLADGHTIGTPLDGNRGPVQHIAIGRGYIVRSTRSVIAIAQPGNGRFAS